jgi:hypothetical protein
MRAPLFAALSHSCTGHLPVAPLKACMALADVVSTHRHMCRSRRHRLPAVPARWRVLRMRGAQQAPAAAALAARRKQERPSACLRCDESTALPAVVL